MAEMAKLQKREMAGSRNAGMKNQYTWRNGVMVGWRKGGMAR
jgi:hypothetical protein